MRTSSEAAKACKNTSTNKVGLCLWHCQDWYQSPHYFPSAIEQWRNAKEKHHGDRTPPYGAPVYYEGGKYGHIAIYVGDGMVRSTDAGGAGKVATVPLDWFKAHWGYSYLGWTGDIGGKSIEFDGGDVALSDKDIQKIAKAVWAFQITDPTGMDNGKPVKDDKDNASTMIKNIRRDTAK